MNDKQMQESIRMLLKLNTGFTCFKFKYCGYDGLILHINNEITELLCGYVGLTIYDRYYGKNLNNIDIHCHGGITFTSFGGDFYRQEFNDEGKKLYWIGFDCQHYCDIEINEKTGRTELNKTPEFVLNEIFDMIDQIIVKNNGRRFKLVKFNGKRRVKFINKKLYKDNKEYIDE